MCFGDRISSCLRQHGLSSCVLLLVYYVIMLRECFAYYVSVFRICFLKNRERKKLVEFHNCDEIPVIYLFGLKCLLFLVKFLWNSLNLRNNVKVAPVASFMLRKQLKYFL